MDRILNSTGSCILNETGAKSSSFTTYRACKKGGGNWNGFDISGHCL
jgi:hypothetical protein